MEESAFPSQALTLELQALPLFDLHLEFSPSFYRRCVLHVEGEVVGTGRIELPPVGVLPGDVFTLSVDANRMADLYAACMNAFSNWDARWSQPGLDGISISGTFESSEMSYREFDLWSPSKSSEAHSMLAAVLDCFPSHRCSGVPGESLEHVRGYLGLQPVLTVMPEQPLRLRIALDYVGGDTSGIERDIGDLPSDVDMLIDVSGSEHIRGGAARTLLAALRESHPSNRWLAREDGLDVLLSLGIARSLIDTIPRESVSPTGEPLVFGDWPVSSPELLALARSGSRKELILEFRKRHGLPMAEAARAAGELSMILEKYDAAQVDVDQEGVKR